MISALFIAVAVCLLISVYGTLKSMIRNTTYHEMMREFESIGALESVGAMLSSMPKCPYIRGADLRFNAGILFYMKEPRSPLFRRQ